VSADDLKGKIVIALHGEDEAKTIYVLNGELTVSRRSALWGNEALLF
jgi:hypothetical protein